MKQVATIDGLGVFALGPGDAVPAQNGDTRTGVIALRPAEIPALTTDHLDSLEALSAITARLEAWGALTHAPDRIWVGSKGEQVREDELLFYDSKAGASREHDPDMSVFTAALQ